MAPRIDEVINQDRLETEIDKKVKKENEVVLPIVWRNVFVFILLHMGALYGMYLCFYSKPETLIFGRHF